jgi:DNA polymerase-3 subunit delta
MASKVDMRKKFFKNFEKRGAVVRFQRPYENQILPWVHHIAKKLDLSLSNEAAEYIHQSIGINLSSIHNELQKVAQYFSGKSNKLGLDDIKQLITRTRVESVFDFVNCLGNGDAANSLTHLATLLGDGENEIGILTMIIRHYRILILCQEAIKQGLNQSQISGRVGVHGYFLKDYLEQAKQSQPKALKEIYNLLLETDRALKSSPLSSHIWLENLVIQACAIQQSQQHYPSYPSSNQI